MPRLPIPGSDTGNWGEILNEFLEQAHEGDGSLKDAGILTEKYTKPADGIPKTDLQTTIQASLDKADVSLDEAAVQNSVATALQTSDNEIREAVVNAAHSSYHGVSVIPIGDSNTIENSAATYWDAGGWFFHAAFLSKGKWIAADNAAVSGNTSAQMLARFATDVIAKSPDICPILGGTNDQQGSIAPSMTVSNLRQMWTMAQESGILPIAITIPPRNDGYHTTIDQLNGLIMWEASKLGIPVFDLFSLLVDPANGNYKAGYDNGDGIHFSDIARRVIASEFAAFMDKLLPTPPALYLSRSVGDNLNKLTNGVFVGDTNTDGVANNWTLSSSVQTIIPELIPGENEVVGNWQKLNVTVAGAGRSLRQGFTTGFSAGHLLEFSFRLRTSGIQAGGQVFVTRLDLTGGSWAPNSKYSVLGHDHDGEGVIILRPRLQTLPSVINASFITSSTGTGTMEIAQVTLRNLTIEGLDN